MRVGYLLSTTLITPFRRSLDKCISFEYYFPLTSTHIHLTLLTLNISYLLVCQIAVTNNNLHRGGLKSLVSTMSATVETSLPIRAAKQSTTHPLAPVNAAEIKQAVSYVRAQWPTDTDLHFKCITLQEPAKKEVVPYLEAEASGAALPQIDRRVLITYYIRRTVCYPLIAILCALLELSLTPREEQIPRSSCQFDYRDAGVQCSSWP